MCTQQPLIHFVSISLINSCNKNDMKPHLLIGNHIKNGAQISKDENGYEMINNEPDRVQNLLEF